MFLLAAIIFVSITNLTSRAQADDDEEDFEENNSIMICCTWGEKLGDGKLTYNIEGKVTAEKKEAVRDAIIDWDDKLDLLEFIEIVENQDKKQKEKGKKKPRKNSHLAFPENPTARSSGTVPSRPGHRHRSSPPS